MKVYLRSEGHVDGAYIGDVDPREFGAVFDAIEDVGVYDADNGDYVREFSHQVYYTRGEAYFEIVLS